MKGEVRAAKRASFGKIVRKRLSDITNSPLVHNKIPSEGLKPVPFSSEITKDNVDQLIQENGALVKLVEERNKIIELSGAELQRLRISYQKTQLQNWNLAQTNSQMLAELNLAKDKLKAFQHELACKEALLKAKKLEVERNMVEKNVVENGHIEAEAVEGKEKAGESVHKPNDKQKQAPSRNRRHHQRSQSMGVPSTNKQDLEKEKAEKKRRCLRRQSARFMSQEREPAENLFEIEEAKFPITTHPEAGPSSSDQSSMKEDKENDASSGADEDRRSSVARPLRRAAEKVQSYKEPPLNVKMRRVE
ncbi:shugoshin-1 [Punica granatum]|uniref:Shugoshin-1 n=1 Tax=Punica granatum TaxID=22663 RepID=A0A218W803_PUNGR|nr:shugoshin-1 [Punica granatum]OWM68925.1 hypothetical protein CDL15_Pgr025112 [Punica granatum]